MLPRLGYLSGSVGETSLISMLYMLKAPPLPGCVSWTGVRDGSRSTGGRHHDYMPSSSSIQEPL
jgi:hypothetical protein